MKYMIMGKGGQGVLFIAKAISQALILSKAYEFTFLKEFDEGQRNGEIKITFTIPIQNTSITRTIKENNIIELKKIARDFGLNDKVMKEALQVIKPNAFEKNWEIYNGKN